MSKLKPTPGPWIHDKRFENGISGLIVGWNRIPILSSMDVPNWRENLQLACAAPELLQCLEMMIAQCPCSVKERLSGHKIDCLAVEAQHVVDKANGNCNE